MTDTEYLGALRHLKGLYERRRQRSAERMRPYLHDPAGWVRDCVRFPAGRSLADYQRESMTDVVTYRRLAVRGPHGLGKSTTMSLLVLWFATTRAACGIDWKVITTASVWRQLDTYLWPEIHKWSALLRWNRLGREAFSARVELLDLRLKLAHGAASAVASNQAERIEGAHADHILYILDEAKISSQVLCMYLRLVRVLQCEPGLG